MMQLASRATSRLMSFATKAMRRLSLYTRLAWYEVLGICGHDDFVRFIVLTRSRTGSNLLLSFLNSHPDIFCEGEIFATLGGANPLARLRSVYKKQPRHIQAKGFKIFYYHPLDAKADELWKELELRTEIRVIHLRRENALRTLLSRKIAGMQDTWTATRYDKVGLETRRVHFTVQELEEGLRQTQQWEAHADVQFQAHPMLRLSYEELVNDPRGNYVRLLAFLDAREHAPATNLRRQNPESLKMLISNYGELKAEFSGTQWARHFDE